MFRTRPTFSVTSGKRPLPAGHEKSPHSLMWTALTVRPTELDKVPTTLVSCIGKGSVILVICKGNCGKIAFYFRIFPKNGLLSPI